ncbi:hypothetical protein C4D60_Mb01t08160 [Musa balbisiana]|uniref:Uncharacterized protein n=1 Tax=Musa balbisiana TaxID=52838 RepID=A0A4V4H773_MUSBA|nr:hypothetical protein C4D60_Mb01t08160 [Musa balbisiana]
MRCGGLDLRERSAGHVLDASIGARIAMPSPPPPPSCLSSLAVHLYPICSVLNCLHVGQIPNMPVYKFNFHCLCSSACLVWARCVDRVAHNARERETVVVIGRSVLCLKAILFPLSSRSFWIKLNR